eukprot:COSAG04_NODE_6355_length_1349_cov_1.054400_1_plen_221_part_00
MPAQLQGLVLPLLALLCPQQLHPTAAEEPVWTLVFRQTTTEGKAVWQSMDDWRSYGSSDADANYSVLDHLDELLGPDRLYHLKLLYPLSHKGQSNEWTQTQSPMKSEGKNAKIAGYTAIHCDWTNGPFIGLQLCSDAVDDKSTLLCSQNNRGNWWCAPSPQWVGRASGWVPACASAACCCCRAGTRSVCPRRSRRTTATSRGPSPTWFSRSSCGCSACHP